MRPQHEIAKLIVGNENSANQFINHVNRALQERASLRKIAHALRKLPPEERTVKEVVIALGGKVRQKKHNVDAKVLKTEDSTKIKSRPTRRAKTNSHQPQLKPDWREFESILKSYGVTRLYHFTDILNLRSVREYNGLYSWSYCEEHGLLIPRPGGNNLSRQLDVSRGLADYVRLNFNPNPPMLYGGEQFKNVVIFEVDPVVIYWKETKFSDFNAADSMASIGEDLEYFKKIRFDVAVKEYWYGWIEKKLRQAEVMVKTHVPISLIKIHKYGDKNALSDEVGIPLSAVVFEQ